MSEREEYLTEQIITYLGNKRSLLTLLFSLRAFHLKLVTLLFIPLGKIVLPNLEVFILLKKSK